MIKRADKGINVKNANWKFSGEVAKRFDRHISRSVPYYSEGHDLINKISDFFIKNKSNCCEIGSSTGTLLSKLYRRHKDKNASFLGIEIEKDMVKVSKKKNRKKNKNYQQRFFKHKTKR